MADEKPINEQEILERIKELFEAERDCIELDEEMKRFIEERRKLEQSDASWSMSRYLQLYEKLKIYGLDEKMMKNLEFFIRLELQHNRNDFLKSEFYKKFKDHKILSRAKRDYD